MTRITLAYASLLVALLLLADFGTFQAFGRYVNQTPPLDKVIHFAMFGVLALLANAALAQWPRWPLVAAIATGSILVMVASTVEECTNMLTVYRHWSLADLAANYLGIVCVGVLPLVGRKWIHSGGDDAHRGSAVDGD